MADVEAVGEAATGGLLGRAVEPGAGEARDGHTGEANCLNCGCSLAGDYCHCCGQRAHVHRTIAAWWHDFLHSVLHLDGKFWRTLPMLVWRPGELTRRYARGERAKFISPLALFLFTVFLMFAVFTLVGGPIGFASTTPAQDRAEAQREIAAERAEAARDLAELEQELAQASAQGRSTQSIEVRIRGVRNELEAEERAYRLAARLADGQEQRDSAQTPESAPAGPALEIGETGLAPLDRAFSKAEKNPSLLLYKLQTNAYKFSWALIPISLPFVWLLFLHRRRYRREFGAYDHLIFITYSIAFMSLGAVLLALLRPLGIGDSWLWAAIGLIPPIHMYRQLRDSYRLSRWSALWRTFVLLNLTFIALSFFLTLLLMLGVLG